MYRVGIIGCGNISAVHARTLRELENTELAACADVIPERAARYGCPAYQDWERMLSDVRPDAVHLCTPHHLHPVMAQEAARRGIAVFTEKPPAIDQEGWETVKQAARLVPVGICFQNRFHPGIRMIRNMIDGGDYGPLRGIRGFVTWNRTKGYYEEAAWKGRWATEGGGALINQSIHTLDLILRFLGEPDTVEASMRNHHLRDTVEVEDTVEIYLRRDGIPALLYASTAYSQDAPVIFEVHLEHAVLRLEGDLLTVVSGGTKQEIPLVTDEAMGRAYWGSGHKACIADFYRSVETGEAFRNSPSSCENTMKTLFRVYDQCRPDL